MPKWWFKINCKNPVFKSSDFTEQLDVLRQQFRETTDRLINSIETAYDTLLAQEWPGKEEALSSEDGQEDSSSPPPSTTKRRASVFGQANSFDPKVLLGNEESDPDDELFQEMRRLSETSDSRRLQVWQTNEQLKKAQQTLKELKQAIKIKVIQWLMSDDWLLIAFFPFSGRIDRC